MEAKVTIDEKILELLKSVGPMTSEEIERLLPEHTSKHVSVVVSRMYCKLKSIRIAGYFKPPAGRAVRVYAAGAGRDVAKEPFSEAAYCRERRARAKAITSAAVRNSSVFAWAQTHV